jgi:bifunctional DNase/RNase
MDVVMDKIKLDLSQVENNDNYETIVLELEQIASDQVQRVFVLLTDGEKKTMYEINNYEASMVTFAFKELHKNSHIQTIYQIFIKYLELQGVSIDKIVIESRVGDVVYATLTLVDKNYNRTFTVCSFADALIMSLMTKRPLQIIAKVWDEMDAFEDDWDYEYYTMDYDEDEDEDD